MNVIPDSIGESLDTLPPEAISFFVVFSRFALALKPTGYVSVGRSSRAKQDWEGVAGDLGQSFFDEVHRSGKAVALLTVPLR